ncbi:MAG: DUF4105 domain-containing protein [Prevotella sp.]|nr:DUF4105 domain-containing protein [Prevotella sp.]
MKPTASILRPLLLLCLVLFGARQGRCDVADSLAQARAHYYDSLEVGLITCSPHEEVYSLYGHAALRVNDHRPGGDWTFNYGVFNYKQPFFVLRFVFGKTDYELGVAPFGEFCKYYRSWGSQVSELVLNLTAQEKERIVMALDENYQPQNRVYRYNFFFDNCATRPRDIIERNIDGRVEYAQTADEGPSFRSMIHDHTQQHPWAAMGNDLLLGVRADLPTTQREQHFLPENLERDFAGARIVGPDGSSRPLVKERRIVVPPGNQFVEEGFPLSPSHCGMLLLAVAIVVMVFEWRRHQCMRWFDALLMLATGLAGCIVVVMFFSEHPATSTNLQVLLLNPLHLVFLPAVVRRRPAARRYWNLLVAMVLLFFVGGLWQHYAEGMDFLALSLLLRYWSHLRNDK